MLIRSGITIDAAVAGVAPGERHAVVEPEQRRSLAPLPHHHGHVVDQAPQVVGDLVEGVRHQLLEALQRYVHHRAQRRVAVDGPRGAPRGARRRPTSRRDLHGDAPGRARPRRLGQDAGPHPADRPPGGHRARPTLATCWPSPSPARRPASSTSASAASGLRGDATTGTFHAVAWGTLRTRWADLGPAAARPARPQGTAPRASWRPSVPGKDKRTVAGELATEIEWAKARMVTPDDYVDAVGAGRRASRPCEPDLVAEVYAGVRAPQAPRRAWSTSTTCSRWSPGRSRRTRRSRPRSAGATATCSSTSSRT